MHAYCLPYLPETKTPATSTAQIRSTFGQERQFPLSQGSPPQDATFPSPPTFSPCRSVSFSSSSLSISPRNQQQYSSQLLQQPGGGGSASQGSEQNTNSNNDNNSPGHQDIVISSSSTTRILTPPTTSTMGDSQPSLSAMSMSASGTTQQNSLGS